MRDDIDRKCGYCTFTDKDARVVVNHIINEHPEIVKAASQLTAQDRIIKGNKHLDL